MSSVRNTPAMPPRRLLTLMVLVLMSVVIASAMTTTGPPQPQNGARSPAPSDARAIVVRGRLPGDRTVKAVSGQVVELDITSLEPDTARIDALGIKGPVGPGLDGPALTFVANATGSFPVTLGRGGKPVGVVSVRAAR